MSKVSSIEDHNVRNTSDNIQKISMLKKMHFN